MIERKFRAWNNKEECLVPDVTWSHNKSLNAHMSNGYFTFMQDTGALDMDGTPIYEGDIVNVLYTSDNGEHRHDCIYSVKPLGNMGLVLKFEKLLWTSYGYNQFPVDSELSIRYSSIYMDYKDMLLISNTYGTYGRPPERMKRNDTSSHVKVIGNIFENKDLLKEAL